ncbi:MAG TPA: phosphatase PAP2 family protein [Nitrospira sp.]|nr:phosphatase PAP2 family protein [Nitrospira sp.]
MSSDELRESGSQRAAPRFGGIAVFCCSSAALSLAFIGVIQLDLPIVRYVRSVTIHLPWDQLTIPWMAFTSNAGDWIGEGSHLVAVSLALLTAGWFFSKPTVLKVGFETLLSHGIAALLTNALKHLIGRPRPKFVHSGEWQFTPSWASGLDSFPSGHAAASFAVAIVIAKRFPAFGPLCMGVALFVALSRVLRGSHFPTDVAGGAILGALSGSLASAPLTQWRASLQSGLLYAAIGTCALLALVWTLSHPMEEGIAAGLLVGLGVVAMTTGLWLRLTAWMSGTGSRQGRSAQAAPVLVAYGLAAMTTAPLVLASVGFACLAVWFTAPEEPEQGNPAWVMMREGILFVAVLLALLTLYQGRGVLPFR